MILFKLGSVNKNVYISYPRLFRFIDTASISSTQIYLAVIRFTKRISDIFQGLSWPFWL